MADDLQHFGFYDLAPIQESFRDAVLEGLSRPNKAIPPRFLYDERGAALFGEITRLPEYYPTRTELGILASRAGEMAARMGPRASLIEFGASASDKCGLVLAAMTDPLAYVPIDVSGEHLQQTAREIAERFPALTVAAVCADYTQPFALPTPVLDGGGRRVGFFPGSTIGNLVREEAVEFLRMWRGQLGAQGAMLIGVDLKKDKAVLEAAYNDAAGVTAEFTHNLLARANRELEADFDLTKWRHDAFYDEHMGRIEIRLLSLADQDATVAGRRFRFRDGESIHTEYSCKYTVEEFTDLAAAAGFRSDAVWTDQDRLFSVHYLTAS